MGALEREVLVCYDVSNSKNRARLLEALKGLGLLHVQESVLWGFLREAEIREAQRLLEDYVDPLTDRGFIVPAAMQFARVVGYDEGAFAPPPRSRIL